MRSHDAARRGVTVDAARMHALACEYQKAPSREALDAALEACLPLCALIARRFSSRGADYDDLYQVACLSCVQAVKGFQMEKGYQFSTYLTPTVTGAVRNYLRDKESALRTPRMLKKRAAELERTRESFLLAHHAEPTARQLAESLGWDMSRVLQTLSTASLAPVSLDQLDGEGQSMLERLPFLETGYERIEQRSDLAAALSALTEKEREMVSLRYTQGLSQRETAQRMNMTQMQVSRMERRLLSFLRKEMNPDL